MADQEEDNLEATFGPAARFSEHKRGEHITYRSGGGTWSGTILWISPPGPVVVGGQDLPVHYLVEPDGAGDSWPHTVFSSDIIVRNEQSA